MKRYPTIDLYIRHLSQNGVDVIYSTCDAANTISIFNPIEMFLNIDEAFVISRSIGFRSFSMLRKQGEGVLEYTVRTAAHTMYEGEKLLRLLNGLADIDVDTPQMDVEVENLMLAVDIPTQPYIVEHQAASTVRNGSACYRTYLSSADIANIFAFPNQESYGLCQYLVVVEATACLHPDTTLRRIMVRLEPYYYVVTDATTKAVPPACGPGTPISLTYHPAGYEASTVNIVAGQKSPYVEYRAPFIRVLPAVETPLKLVPTSIPDVDVELLIDFGDGRQFSQQLKLSPMGEEYLALEVGEFHGFTAMRAGDSSYHVDLHAPLPDFKVTNRQGDTVTPESFTDDSKPTADDKGDAQHWASQPIEEDEELTVDTPKRRRGKGSKWLVALLVALAVCGAGALIYYLPGIMPSSKYDEMEAVDVTESTPEAMADAVDSLNTTVVDETVAKVDTAEAPETSETNETPAVEETPATVAEVTAPAEPAISADEKADIEYLNSHNLWKRSQLKSEKYRAFFDLFAAGDIKKLAQADYFAVKGQATNAMALKTIDMLWQAYTSPTQRSNEVQLRKLKGKGEIDLPKLYDTLARYRDKNPNTSPRPVR